MAQARLLLTAGLAFVAFSYAVALSHLQIDFQQGDVSGTALKGRRLHQADQDVVCYEGCLDAPINDNGSVPPLPTLLLSEAGPVALLDCYTKAVDAGFAYFAIYNETKCYGGPNNVVGWAPDSCSLDCKPGGDAPYICGAVNKASVFSMGYCLRVNGSCLPSVSPPAFSPPPAASPPPSPSLASPPPFKPASPSIPTGEGAPPEHPDSPPPTRKPPPPPSPAAQKVYTCAETGSGIFIEGTELPNSPKKLTVTTRIPIATNVATCKKLCDDNAACFAFAYKLTGNCFTFGKGATFSTKHYSTAYMSCTSN